MVETANHLGMSALISHPEHHSIEEQMAIFAEAGFDSFFLSYGVTDEFEKIPYWSNCARNISIAFEAVHAPSAMVNSVWTGSKNAALYQDKLESILDFCSEGQIPKVVVHVGANPNIDPTQRGLDFWKSMESYAERRGVKLCYENTNAPKLFEAVIASADTYHGFCFDVGHQLCYTPEKDYINIYGKQIIYTHIHDNFADGRDMHLVPKDGINDWDQYFLSLNRIGYTGTLNLELSCYHKEAYRNMTFKEFVEYSYKRIVALTKA